MATRFSPQVQPDEQAGLLEIAMLIVREAPAETVFGAVAEATARRLRTDSAAVMRYLGDERAVIVGVLARGRRPRPAGQRGAGLRPPQQRDRPRAPDGQCRLRADSYEGLAGELPVMMRAIDVRSSVAAPIVGGRRDLGRAGRRRARARQPFPEGSEHRIGDLAELAASAVAREQTLRRLEASRRRIVEEADAARRRLERELHEGTQQHLPRAHAQAAHGARARRLTPRSPSSSTPPWPRP